MTKPCCSRDLPGILEHPRDVETFPLISGELCLLLILNHPLTQKTDLDKPFRDEKIKISIISAINLF